MWRAEPLASEKREGDSGRSIAPGVELDFVLARRIRPERSAIRRLEPRLLQDFQRLTENVSGSRQPEGPSRQLQSEQISGIAMREAERGSRRLMAQGSG